MVAAATAATESGGKLHHALSVLAKCCTILSSTDQPTTRRPRIKLDARRSSFSCPRPLAGEPASLSSFGGARAGRMKIHIAQLVAERPAHRESQIRYDDSRGTEKSEG